MNVLAYDDKVKLLTTRGVYGREEGGWLGWLGWAGWVTAEAGLAGLG